jgi:SAM-dependent methyltransferase
MVTADAFRETRDAPGSPLKLLSLFGVVVREIAARRATAAPRVPEHELVMEQGPSVTAFVRAGRETGVTQPAYLLGATHASRLIEPGDTVLDLGCGPGTHLVALLDANPAARFVGLDLSDPMLRSARAFLAAYGGRVELRRDDMSAASTVPTASIDVVVSTYALHHLPSLASLRATLATARRVLKPGGRVCLLDFSRLKRDASMHAIARLNADLQDPALTSDTLHSLRAAFTVDELADALRAAGLASTEVHAMAGAPVLALAHSPARRALRGEQVRALAARLEALPPRLQRDHASLASAFALGGLPRVPLRIET